MRGIDVGVERSSKVAGSTPMIRFSSSLHCTASLPTSHIHRPTWASASASHILASMSSNARCASCFSVMSRATATPRGREQTGCRSVDRDDSPGPVEHQDRHGNGGQNWLESTWLRRAFGWRWQINTTTHTEHRSSILALADAASADAARGETRLGGPAISASKRRAR